MMDGSWLQKRNLRENVCRTVPAEAPLSAQLDEESYDKIEAYKDKRDEVEEKLDVYEQLTLEHMLKSAKCEQFISFGQKCNAK